MRERALRKIWLERIQLAKLLSHNFSANYELIQKHSLVVTLIWPRTFQEIIKFSVNTVHIDVYVVFQILLAARISQV